MSAEDIGNEEVVEKNESGKESGNELSELKSRLDEIMEESNKKSALIRKLGNKLETLESQITTPKVEEPKKETGSKDSASEIERRIRDRESALEEKHQKRAKLHGISAALENSGLSKDKARRFAKLIEMEEGNNLQVALDDFDDYTLVGVKTSDGEIISTNKWMQEYLSSEKGSAFKPPVKGPTPPISRNGQSNNSDRKKVSAIEFANMMSTASREERKALAEKYEIVG